MVSVRATWEAFALHVGLFASRLSVLRVGYAALLLVAAGARTSLASASPEPASAFDAGPQPARCLDAPQPTALVSLETPGTLGAAHYSLTGDASRLYTYVWGPSDANEYSP